MCGIFGIIPAGKDVTPDEGKLRASMNLLGHRGPDSAGIYAARGIGLAHTRLALLDLNPRASQPFWDESNTSCIVYNGEVYNFAALRTELRNEGVSFRTTSDTEVVLNAALKWGVDKATSKFEGMFAFALWDARSRELTLARDRFGIKPLMLARQANQFLFTSEIEALRPWMTLEPDLRSLYAFLYGSGGPMSGQTFLQDVSYVPPGASVRFEPGHEPYTSSRIELGDLVDPTMAERLDGSKDGDLIDKVESLLFQSVEEQLIADAPVGVLCSGGVDSSLILAIAAKRHSDLAVFHADVVGSTSERGEAESVASHLGLDLRIAEVRDDDFINLLPKLSRHHGSPFHLNPSCVPFYIVSQLVRDSGVKAVLTGEGSDETFLGYPWLAPGRTRRIVNKLAYNTSRTPSTPAVDLMTAMLEGFESERDHDVNENHLSELAPRTRASALPSLDLLGYNLRGLLHRNDAMGMAASIESRFPFLDSKLVTVGVNLPLRAKIRRGPYPTDRRHPFAVDKWVLRQVADRHLPKSISRRPKYPFATSAYQRMDLDPALLRDGFVGGLLRLDDRGYERLVRLADNRLRSKLLHLETWGRTLIRGESDDEVTLSLQTHVKVNPA